MNIRFNGKPVRLAQDTIEEFHLNDGDDIKFAERIANILYFNYYGTHRPCKRHHALIECKPPDIEEMDRAIIRRATKVDRSQGEGI